MDYLVPPDLAAALEMTAAGIPALAGGTDFYPSLVGRPSPPAVVDIAALDELRGIVETSEGHRIGALTRWADVASASLPPRFDGLRAAAGEVGSVQVQNAGTVGGNLCNASPAADGVPPLLTLDASVELTAIHVGADEWHFHGGSRRAPMVHVAVTGGAPEWGEPVSDEEFDEGF